MACESIVGVKNILLTFHDCDTDQVFGPYSHELASDELPTLKLCPYTNETLTGGYTRRTYANSLMTMNVIRDLRIPLSYYQGCAALDAQIEYENGLVYTAKGGTHTGDDQSDTHSVTLTLSYKTIDELLPEGALIAA
jgi:hypothetical protein